VEFEWDDIKGAKNERKHGVSFHEAATVFGDPLAITFGVSRLAHYLVVAHTEREGRMRIISTRKMTKHERTFYEEG